MRKFLLCIVLFPLLSASLTAQQPPTTAAAQREVAAKEAHERVAAKKATINSISLEPKTTAIEHGRKIVEFRASVAVAAIRKAIADGTPAQQGATAPPANPRFGKWRLKPTDPAAPPSTNVMTYEPHERTGMKVTISRLEADGSLTAQWGYTTLFDNTETAMTGSRSTQTAAVRMLDERTAQITYRRDGQIVQQLTNVLSADGHTIGIIYMNYGAEGKPDTVTFATYERMK